MPVQTTKEKAAAASPKTRTRRTDSEKAEQSAEETAAKEARAAEKAQAKADRDAAKAEEKAKRDAERAEIKAQKEQERAAERQELIEAGRLIEVEVDGSIHSYVAVDDFKKESVALRAEQVIEDLKAANGTPIRSKELEERYGGGTVQWVAYWGILRKLGLVQAYRVRTGSRGESGLAYSWIGDK